jgi:predicted DNA-binding transcriptional regulator YafY
MRADRLLSILLLLQVHRRMTARDLAERLEVSERTIHRDMEALAASGVPVIAERGASGGWLLPDGYQTTLTGLTQAEARALLLAQPPRLLADLGLNEAAEAARMKLQASLPSRMRENAGHIAQRIHIDPAGWRRAADCPAHLATVQAAIYQDRKLRMTYQKADESTVEREVEPLGLVAKGATWYLLATHGGEFRTYRVARIAAAEVLPDTFIRPDGFDLAAAWSQARDSFAAALPRLLATLRVAGAALPRMKAGGGYSDIERIDPPDAHGWSTVAIRFQGEEDAAAYVLGFGTLVRVIEPDWLRERIIAQARAVLAFYTAEG